MISYEELVRKAKSQVQTLRVNQVKDWLSEQPHVLILDVREPSEYLESSLPNAINIPRGLLELKINKTNSDSSRPMLLHCGGGGRASLAAKTLKDMGYTNIAAVDGTYSDLKSALS